MIGGAPDSTQGVREQLLEKHDALYMYDAFATSPGSCLSKVNVWAMSSLLGVW